MLDTFFYGVYKIGDQPCSKGQEFRALKHGDPVDLLPENIVIEKEYTDIDGGKITVKEEAPTIISEHMQKVFLIIKHPIAYLDEYKNSLKEISPPEDEEKTIYDKEKYCPRSKKLNLAEFEKLTGVKEDDLKSEKIVPVVDCTKIALDSKVLEDRTVISVNTIEDRNSESSGGFTVGSAGDYATWSALFADLANLTGDLTGTQIESISTSTQATSSIELGGYTLKCTADISHYGNKSVGRIITQTSDTNIFNLAFTGSGAVEIEKINMTWNTAGSSVGIYVNSTTTGFTALIHDCLIDGAGYTNYRGISAGDANDILQVYKCNIWDCYYALNNFAGNASSVFENNTSYNASAYGIRGNSQAGTYRNCISVGAGTADFEGIGSATGYNNSSEDATAADANWSTGTDNVESITPANEFYSLLDTGTYYLLLKSTSSLIGAGTAPTLFSDYDIKGVKLTASYSIGSHSPNFVSSGDYDIGETGGDFKCFSIANYHTVTLTGDVVYTQISDIDSEYAGSLSASLNGYNLTYTSNKIHKGVLANAWVIKYITPGLMAFNFVNSGNGTIEVNNIYIRADANLVSSNTFGVNVGNITSGNMTIIIRDCLFNSNSNRLRLATRVADDTPIVEIYNCVAWGSPTGGYAFSTAINVSTVIENCIVADSLGRGFDVGSMPVNINNCVAINCGTDCFNGIGSATGYNNADTDGTCADANWSTGSDNVESITPANEFVSLDDTNSYFLKLKASSILKNAGAATSIAGNDHGIRGNIRPHAYDKYSIGADEGVFYSGRAVLRGAGKGLLNGVG